jgi:hypothetical protein
MAFVEYAVLLETCVGEVVISDEMESKLWTVVNVAIDDDTVEDDKSTAGCIVVVAVDT